MAETLKFNTALNASAFQEGMAKIAAVGKAVGAEIAQSFTAVGAAIAASAAAVAAIRGAIAGVDAAFEGGRQLEVLARQTGAGVRGLAVLQQKFKEAGLDSDQVGMSIARLQKSIAGVEDEENKGGAGRLQQLGLNLRELAQISPDQQLERVGRAISAIADPAERSAAAMQIFGRAGAQLGALFNGDFGALPTALDSRAKMLADNAARFERVSIMLGRAGDTFRGFYLGAASGLAKGLEPLLDKISQLDFASVGEKIGAMLTDVAESLTPVLDQFEKLDLANIGKAFALSVRAAGQSLALLISIAGPMLNKAAELANRVASLLGYDKANLEMDRVFGKSAVSDAKGGGPTISGQSAAGQGAFGANSLTPHGLFPTFGYTMLDAPMGGSSNGGSVYGGNGGTGNIWHQMSGRTGNGSHEQKVETLLGGIKSGVDRLHGSMTGTTSSAPSNGGSGITG